MTPSSAQLALPTFWSVGATVTDLRGGRLVHRPGLAAEPTATFLREVAPVDVAELDDLLAAAAAVTGTPCPRLFLDAATPPWVEAELVVRDWTIDAMVLLVLPSDAAFAPPDATIRRACDDDWAALHGLFRADHVEEDRKAGRSPRPAARTDQVVAARRVLPDPVRYFVAEDGGAIVGFVAGWPGEDLGLVEDLYVADDHRGRGVADALLTRAVAHARAGGRRPVVIGAEPADTPKRLYARRGFVPTAVLRAATRR